MAFKKVVLCFLSVIFFTDCFAFNQSCIDTLFLESCLQRNVFRRNYSYVTMTNDLCRIGNQDGLIVLVNVYIGEPNSTLTTAELEKLKIQAGENEANNICLLEHLRPKLSGFTRAANVIVPYQKCGVDNTKGYIVVEYSCRIATESVLEIPKCSGVVNGSRIRIQNAGFPNTGLNTSGDHCQCTIRSEARFLNITTYYVSLSNKQTITIADAHGDSVSYTNISLDSSSNIELLRVNGSLNLTWTNNETITNDDHKFWLEIYGNGELISIACETLWRPTATRTVPTPMRTTKQTFESSSNTGITSTVETAKVPQQGSLPTKYPAQTQLHNELTTTQQRQTKKPDETSVSTRNAVTTTSPKFGSVSTGQSFSNIHVDTTAKGGDSKASNIEEDGKAVISLIRVVVIISACLLIVALLITAILIYKKKQRVKVKDKRKDDKTDNRKEDGASNKPSREVHTGLDDAKTSPKPILPRFGMPTKIQPIVNNSFDLHRLPPINTDTQRQNNLNIAVVSEGLMTEGTEEIVRKKKKRKKKRRKKTAVHPELDEWRREETVFTETETNLE